MFVYNFYDNLFIEQFLFGLFRFYKFKVYGNLFILRKENCCGFFYYGLLNFKIYFIYICVYVFIMKFNKIKNL